MNKSENTTQTDMFCSGYCERCETVHTLGINDAREQSLLLMEKLDQACRIDFTVPNSEADPAMSTDYVFGKARGQMFGVMTYINSNNDKGVAYAFSGQYNAIWEVDGWVPPIVDTQEFKDLTQNKALEIMAISAEMENLVKGTEKYGELGLLRKTMSRALMDKIRYIYKLPNFRGETRVLPEIPPSGKGIPAGTGDCCAPKLLNFAALNNLRPLGIAEFYYGKENKSATKQHKTFYPPCKDKCSLILGYMLCGLKT